ncbi:MAG: molybdenum cofactor guanylyltransferase [Pirellulaceae bacterium]
MEGSSANPGQASRAVIVLCGGKSRRMGRDKASLPFAESTMLAKVVSVAQQLATHVLVVKASEQTLPQIPSDVTVVDDAFPDEGPLRGIVTGLAALPSKVKQVMVLGCDMPLIEAEILAPLFDQLHDFDAVIPEVAGRAQPFAAVYQVWVLPILQKSLDTGNRKMLTSIQALNIRWIELPAAAFDNVNTPADYAQAKAAWLAGLSLGEPPKKPST